MKYLFISLLLWATNPTFHGGHVAEYYYELGGNHLNLMFVIEKADLTHFQLSKDCDIEKMTALCTVKYINANSSIEINGEKIEMELQNSYTVQDHLFIQLKSTTAIDSIKEINIQNNCFYEFDEAYKNRIVLDVAHIRKSFLLDKDRDKLELK